MISFLLWTSMNRIMFCNIVHNKDLPAKNWKEEKNEKKSIIILYCYTQFLIYTFSNYMSPYIMFLVILFSFLLYWLFEKYANNMYLYTCNQIFVRLHPKKTIEPLNLTLDRYYIPCLSHTNYYILLLIKSKNCCPFLEPYSA